MHEIYQKSNSHLRLFERTARPYRVKYPGQRATTGGFLAMVILLGFLILGMNASPALAQSSDTIVVTGVVSDKTGTLPGVSVMSKSNKAVSTVTDARGSYKIKVPSGGKLIFSSIGYGTQEIEVSGRRDINVTLAEDVQSLDEVVVVGYGTQTREKLIGSVAQISGDQIAERPVSQLKLALTGQLPGVVITQRDGSPGNGSGRISIRGVGSFGASPDPLILVDGIVADNFNDIDPNSIESISVLKDASSAAIYGSRAANGVILVTTKSGKTGAPRLSLNSYFGTQRPTVFPDYVNSWEYQEALFQAANKSSELTPDQRAEVEKFRAQNDPDYPNFNYLDAILSKNGMQTGHSLNVTGGTNTNKYNLSLGYLYQDGMVIKNDYSRYNVRLNMTTNITPKLDLITGLAAISAKINEPMGPVGGSSNDMLNMIGQAARFPNVLPAVLPNGDYGIGLGTGSPFSDLESASFNTRKQLNLTGNLRLDYRALEGLKLSFISGYRRNDNREKSFRSSQRINASLTNGPGALTQSSNNNDYYTLQGLADYSRQMGKHFISMLAGYSFEDYLSESLQGYRTNFPSNDLTVLNAGSPDGQTTSGGGTAYALESQFARANYNYASKYLVEAVVRRDGSSRFPTDNKYAVFPSLAAGWRIGEESFLKDKFSWLSELKLKASWGILGNQNISNYPYQNTLGSSGNTSYSFGGAIYPGFARTQIVDSTLHWESTRTKDLGVETGLFKNKLNLSATYFDRYTYDILYAPGSSVSDVLGFGISEKNTGKLLNRGWELTARHANNLGKLSYNINANLTILKNEVLDLGVGNVVQANGMIGNGSTLFIGYPAQAAGYGIYYGYTAEGLFVDDQDVIDYEKSNNQEAINPNPKPGDIRYKDISGPAGVPDGVVDATYDRTVLGSQIPKYSYGISFGGNYSGFDMNVLLQGISGVTGRLQGYAGWALYQNTGNIQRWQYEGRWTEQNPDRNAIYPRIENVPGGGVPNTTLSSYWLLNGSYLRIKNVQLGYTVPKQALKRVGISNVRVYLSGENLHTFSSYPKGWDPEINSGGEFYPIMSTYSLGLNINF